MAIEVHPTAFVDKNAQLGEDVKIGPLATVGPNVKLGARTTVGKGAIVDGHTTIGEDCQIFPYALIGMKTQDLTYKEGSVSYVEIGNRTVIREFATVHLGTADGEKTVKALVHKDVKVEGDEWAVPAGTGFWYVKKGDNSPTIKWK